MALDRRKKLIQKHILIRALLPMNTMGIMEGADGPICYNVDGNIVQEDPYEQLFYPPTNVQNTFFFISNRFKSTSMRSQRIT